MADQNDFEFEIVNAVEVHEFTPKNTKEAIMTDKKVFVVEKVEDNSTLKNSSTTSCEGLDVTIEDVRNNKVTLVSTIDLVIGLMRQVECKEKEVELAKAEAVTSGLDVLQKVDELKLAQQRAKETNDKHAKEVYAQKEVLATEMNELHSRVSGVLNEGGRSVGVLDGMRNALEKRLTVALREKELADKEKVEKVLSAQKVLAYEESQLKKVVDESERLKQEAMKNSELKEFLKDRGHVVDMLDGDISDKCRDVIFLKESLDQAVLLSEVLSCSQMQAITDSSGSSLTTENPKEKNEEPDSHAVPVKSFGFDLNASTDYNVQAALKTSAVIASSGSSSTNGIPNELNEPADSHAVLKKPFVFGLDASTVDHVQSTSQKQIKSGKSPTFVLSPEHGPFPKISDLPLEQQEGNMNVAFGAGVKKAGYGNLGHAASNEGLVASAPNSSKGLSFKSIITNSAFKEGVKGTRKKSHFKKTDRR